jgi:DNA-binding NarL/FixJ family response regulator
MVTSFFIIDDHPLTRLGFSQLLTEAGYRYAGEASSLEQAEEKLPPLLSAPLIILLDLSLAVDDGNGGRKTEDGENLIPWIDQALAAKNIVFKASECPVRVLIFSAFENVPRIQQTVNMGARGYVSKTSSSEDILEAVDAVAEGRVFIDQIMLKKLLASGNMLDALTERERTILIEVQNMLDNSEIAAKLGITVRTVENYISRIYEKTGITSRAGLLHL